MEKDADLSQPVVWVAVRRQYDGLIRVGVQPGQYLTDDQALALAAKLRRLVLGSH